MYKCSEFGDLTRIALAALVAGQVGIAAGAAHAQDGGAQVGNPDQASVTYGPYARFEIGRSDYSADNGYWHPPGYPADPQINFNLSAKDAGFGALAIGYDWQNGFRGDVSLSVSGSANVAGPCSSASDGTPCTTHADISDASIRTAAIMGNVFYSPLEQAGNDSRFQPFLVGGIGLARNKVGQWTRYNAGAGTPTRTFQGDTSVELAWSVGAGAAYQLTRPGEWPVMLEASWRYYDYGTAQGGAQPVGGGSQPQKPLTFDNTAHVIAIGLRVPLQRY
jgi:hypothetical protein